MKIGVHKYSKSQGNRDMTNSTEKCSRDAAPVFIVGMNGSGTTMLADCLANHPDLYVLPEESRVLPYFISRLRSFGDLSELPARRELADALGRSYAYWLFNNNKPLLLTDGELSRPGFSGVVDSIYNHFATAQRKMRWGDKSPMYLQHIKLLAKYFPQAYFLHIYRDGRDVAQSFHRRWKKDPRWTIYRWKKIVKQGRAQGLELDPSYYMEIRYETITLNPELHMKKISDFLDLEFHSSVLRSKMRYLDSPKRNGKKGIVQNSEKWRTYFSKKQLTDLESIAGHYLSELGYGLMTQPGDIDPPTSRLKWWSLRDKIQTTSYLVLAYGLRSAPAYLKKAFSSIKQSRINYY